MADVAEIDDINLLDDEPACWGFQPRPDQPERFDQQQSFYDSKTTGVAWMVGGNGAGTSEIALAKVAKFVLHDQAPPRRDTPFWIISNDYQTVMNTAWKEKLYGHGHIPGSEVDWNRVHWYKSNQDLPFSIPLKPWPGHDQNKNWRLHFKSYDQGRQKMQAQSIGGFCFIEQFPWGLLEEVLRGCREYNFPGSKTCEFTPVDPNLSIEVEEMLENGPEPDDPSQAASGTLYIPEGWEFYRSNTECAMEAGHVSEKWFHEFFGMIPEETRLTRMTGEFATYEGAIYKGFNPHIHLVGDDVIDHPEGAFYRRAIDWGAGPDNAFVNLWAYRNGMGQYFIFDEYYSTDQSMTTVDHLCAIQDQWPWPKNSPHYGMTYADPSSPDNIRIAQKLNMYSPTGADGKPLYQPLVMQRASNAVIEGIEHVQWMLKPAVMTVHDGERIPTGQPRVFIHKKNCPNLARQMRTYRWRQSNDMGLNPADARKEPLKKNDHAVDALRYLLFSEARQIGLDFSSMRKSNRPRERHHGVLMEGR